MSSYEESSIDWPRLRKYAQRVAGETKAPRATKTVQASEFVDEVRRGLFGRTKTVRVTQLVAREVEQDYWLIDDRYFRKLFRLDARNTSTSVERYYYCLLGDGSLVVRTDSYDEFEGPRNAPLHYMEGTHSFGERKFNEGDVTLFDFERGYRSVTGTYPHVQTDNIRGSRRNAHAKGVGLSQRLKKLLDFSTT